ncbi:MAG: hypothetical protein WCC22_08690 [Terriglobales bacterium]
MSDIRVRFDGTGGGASISVDGRRESYSFPLGNTVSRYGSLGLLAALPDDGGESVYRERIRAELLHSIHRYGVPLALLKTFDITPEDWQ